MASLSPKIYALNTQHISDEKLEYHLKVKGYIFPDFFIRDNNKSNIFTIEYRGGRGYFKNPENDEVLYKYKRISHFNKPDDLIISSFINGMKINNIMCHLKKKYMRKRIRYHFNFYNVATGKNELLDIICRKYCWNSKIYYGNKNNGELICTLDRDKGRNFNIKMELNPKIDVTFMIIVVSFIYNIVQNTTAMRNGFKAGCDAGCDVIDY